MGTKYTRGFLKFKSFSKQNHEKIRAFGNAVHPPEVTNGRMLITFGMGKTEGESFFRSYSGGEKEIFPQKGKINPLALKNSSRKSFLGLNFGIPGGLHQIVHHKDQIDGIMNRCLSATSQVA